MRHKKIMQSLMGKLTRLFKRGNGVAPLSKASAQSDASPGSEDGLDPYLPGPEEIVVVEVDQVEFVQEWSQTTEFMNHGNQQTEAAFKGDRRLFDYDRRRPNHDRRAGDGHERRGGSLWVGASLKPTDDEHKR